jgi:hypothetical protein
MIFMYRRNHFYIYVVMVSLSLALLSFTAGAQPESSYRGRKYKSPPPTARVQVTVLRDVDGKPLENAAVVFHTMEDENDKGNMELKTNEDGKTLIDVLPIGDTVRLQVIAKGFQTFGDDYKLDKAEMAIEIRMKRPGKQYSVYENHPQAVEGGRSPEAAKPAAPPQPSQFQQPN